MGQLIADRYELKDVVGRGGMSVVYCAHDTQLERNVALKILHDHYSEDDDYVERFRSEARAAAQLSHPGIVTVIDRGEEDGRQFIVFEFVEGETLKDLVDRGGPLPVRSVIEYGLEVGRALAFAHNAGLIHRDIKPQNVLVNGEGHAKVTDFGIARSLDAVGQTQTGTVLGTSHYIAPEQARGERVDAQTDVYSFGVVLYELLAGEVPFPGDNFLTVAMRHVNEEVPSLLEKRPDCPLRLASLVERCMAKEPRDRPDGMTAVVEELQACLAEVDNRGDGDATMIVRSPVRKQSRPRKQRPPRRRRAAAGPAAARTPHPLLYLLLGTLVFALVLGGLLFLRNDGPKAVDTPRAKAAPVVLTGISSYDPEGDGVEHPETVASATDGNASTYWTTESYRNFTATKSGVGLVLDAGSARDLSSVTVTTDTPGYTAEIKASDSPDGGFRTVAGGKTVAASTTWELKRAKARYLLVWITALEGRAHVNEVTAR